jgi:hypothetical protein
MKNTSPDSPPKGAVSKKDRSRKAIRAEQRHRAHLGWCKADSSRLLKVGLVFFLRVKLTEGLLALCLY